MKELYEAMVKDAFEGWKKRHPNADMNWQYIKDHTNFNDLSDVRSTINILNSKYGNR